MKTTYPNAVSFRAMRIVFPLCVALTCLSQPAAANITIGPANGPVICDSDNNTCSSDTPLKVGPGPNSGGPPPIMYLRRSQ
jgi:hypothetical protein